MQKTRYLRGKSTNFFCRQAIIKPKLGFYNPPMAVNRKAKILWCFWFTWLNGLCAPVEEHYGVVGCCAVAHIAVRGLFVTVNL